MQPVGPIWCLCPVSLKKGNPQFSARRRVDRKILFFSLTMGVVGAALAASAYVVHALPELKHQQQINRDSLSRITCTGSTCDSSEYTTDWLHEDPDYLIDAQTRFFLEVPPSEGENSERYAPLDFADTNFIRAFRQPASYRTPNGEEWRLYSREATRDGRNVEIIIGFALQAPWKMLPTPLSEIRTLDNNLKREADKTAATLPSGRGTKLAQRLSADGLALVDADTGQVVFWGPMVPTFLPSDKRLPTPGGRLYSANSHLYVVQTDSNERLVAVSLVSICDIWWLAALAGLAYVATGAVTRGLSRRFLSNYFAITGLLVPNLDEACHSGEGQQVEFKRGLSEDETRSSNAEDDLLRSIAAFANTNDGVIFVGVDDSGKIRGLEFDFNQRDRFERKIRQLVRHRLKPGPPIQINFEDVRGVLVAKIAAAHGQEPLYLLNGVIYVRSGSSDVQAQPEDVKKLVAGYAF